MQLKNKMCNIMLKLEAVVEYAIYQNTRITIENNENHTILNFT